jgi:protein TonB
MMPRLRALLGDSGGDYARWGICFALVVGLHVAGVAALLAHNDDDDLVANPPVITIDLSPLAVSPDIVPTDVPVGPQQVETLPDEEPPPPPPPEVSVQPPEPPKKPPQKKKVVKQTTAPARAERHAEVAAAPSAGAFGRNPNAAPNWRSQLVATLERNKRYPSEAQSRGDHGVAQLAFSVDRQGGVHNAHIMRSSGSSILDNETLAMVHRASPLPPPPPEVPGGQISIVVPIRYNVR